MSKIYLQCRNQFVKPEDIFKKNQITVAKAETEEKSKNDDASQKLNSAFGTLELESGMSAEEILEKAKKEVKFHYVNRYFPPSTTRTGTARTSCLTRPTF